MSNINLTPDENDHPQAGEPNFIDTNAEAKANLAPIQAPPQEPLPDGAVKGAVVPPQTQAADNKDADKKVSTAKSDTKKAEPPKGKNK